MIKILLIILGTISLSFGIVGIIVPGLPTTPFLLLSAGLYLRGSEKLYKILIHNRLLGPYILRFKNDKGMTFRTKLVAILIMWSMIFMSTLLLISNRNIDIILYAAGFTGTVVMGLLIPTIGIKTNS